MSSTRFLLSAACSLVVPLVACGSSGNGGVDASNGAAEGTHYGYVVSKAYVPTTAPQALDWGLDIGTAKTPTPDGTIDNTLGGVFALLASRGLDVQKTITTAIDFGTIMLLVDYQTKDFTAAPNSGLTIKIGGTSTPPACSSPTDAVCRHHLDGNASFTLSSTSPTDAAVTGPVVGGTFNGGPGSLSLQLAVGSIDPILLSLHNARIKVTTASATNMTATLGGALTLADINTRILPSIHNTLTAIIDADCPQPRNPASSCSCKTASTFTIIGLFDGDIVGTTKDCVVSLDEVLQSPFLMSVLAPDVCSTASCAKPDSVSLGIKFDAVKATFQ